MKPKLWDGPSAIGEAKVRHLETIDAPYLTASGPGFTARKKGGFTEVTQTGGEADEDFLPYLLTQFKYGDPDTDGFSVLSYQTLDLERRLYKRLRFGPIYDYDGTGSVYAFPGLFSFVGDDFVIHICNDGGESLGARDQVWFVEMWYVRGTNKDQITSGAMTAQVKRHVLFDGSAVSGTRDTYKTLTQTATGWGGEASRYWWCFAYVRDDAICKVPNTYGEYNADTASPYTNIPTAYAGNTKGQLIGYDLPHWEGRFHFMSPIWLTGPGKMMMLVTVKEEPAEIQMQGGTWKYGLHSSAEPLRQQRAPYLLTSTNHGQSWSVTDASFLNEYLYLTKISQLTATEQSLYANRYMNSQLEIATSMSCCTYVGNGISLILINGLFDEASNSFHPMMFRYMNGSFTRISFPGDSWPLGNYVPDVVGTDNPNPFGYYYATQIGVYAVSGCDIRPFFLEWPAANNPRCFGAGCAYFTVTDVTPTAGQSAGRIMYTRDYGNTWQFSPYFNQMLSTPVNVGLGGMHGGVVSPYISPDEPGKIVFIGVEYATDKAYALVTDGNFQTFKVRRVKDGRESFYPALSPQGGAYAWIAAYNSQACYIGDGASKKPYVYPGLPGEFDEPES